MVKDQGKLSIKHSPFTSLTVFADFHSTSAYLSSVLQIQASDCVTALLICGTVLLIFGTVLLICDIRLFDCSFDLWECSIDLWDCSIDL